MSGVTDQKVDGDDKELQLAKKLKTAGMVLSAASKMQGAYKLGSVALEDFKNGTTKNTVNQLANVAVTSVAHVAGARIGAEVERAVTAEVGPLGGAVIGGLAGQVAARVGAHAVAQCMAEKLEQHGIKGCDGCCPECGEARDGATDKCAKCGAKSKQELK